MRRLSTKEPSEPLVYTRGSVGLIPVGEVLVCLLIGQCVHAAQVPAGAELHIRLTAKISSADARPDQPVNAVLIAPYIGNGQIILPPAAEITGVVQAVESAAADPQKPPTLDLNFTLIAFDSERDPIRARISAVDNAKEKVDGQGVITGAPSSKAYTTRINRGIEKMSGNDQFSSLAGILQAAKKALVSDADPDITYEEGVEMTLKITTAFTVARPSAGFAAEVQPVPNDAALAALVAHLPLRALSTEQIPSDITNLVFIGSEEQLASAFKSAGWSTAAKLNGLSKFETARALVEQRGYKEAPVSVLLVDNRPPDLVFQKQNDTFDARHHLRIWRRAGSFANGPIWVCAATHDIAITYSEREGTFIHRIDPNVDDERAKVVNDLIFAREVSALALVPRENVPASAVNATGDPLHTDGQVAVIVLK